ncbi:hypothetical protein CYMTET_46283 [Cymbomonas tetramitiformis]|uniref:Uncharacterized protein n=1 Tax=Cymbomonas tetramitiformis TaxID=36881 RepID=A0AAE0BWG2_9CHLO|nr:hypothetical protein CYMTET_46283 [Cymbomonas tetramitiformis]
MTDKTALEQLGRYNDVRLLELSHGSEAFCGWEDPKLTEEFDQLTKHAFVKKWQFKYMETGMVGQPTYKYWVPYDQFDWKDGFEDPRPLRTAKDEPQCKK